MRAVHPRRVEVIVGCTGLDTTHAVQATLKCKSSATGNNDVYAGLAHRIVRIMLLAAQGLRVSSTLHSRER